MKYIKLRQEQVEIVESERDIEYLLSYFDFDEDDKYYKKNTNIPWSELITEDVIIAAAKADVVYFAEHQLNNIIIIDEISNKKTTLINFLREYIYDCINDDDDFYEVIDSYRGNTFNGQLIVVEEEE